MKLLSYIAGNATCAIVFLQLHVMPKDVWSRRSGASKPHSTSGYGVCGSTPKKMLPDWTWKRMLQRTGHRWDEFRVWIKKFTSLQTKLGHALSGFERFLDRVKAGFFPPNEM